MKEHLSDEQFSAAVLYEGDESTRNHAAACTACGEEIRAFQDALGVWVEEIVAAEPAESFWQRQREAIGARVSETARLRPWKRLLWATAAVVVVLLATVLVSRRPAPSPAHARLDPDDQLLLSVQQSIQSDLPQALQPAALLTQEMDRAAQTGTNP